jgi:hypothetical protein
MASGDTPLLGLTLPVTGELPNAWGNEVNYALTNILEASIAGVTTFSADADVTLTTTTGTDSSSGLTSTSAQYAIIVWSASNSVTRNITAPAKSKTYVVVNRGTAAIVFRGTGPTTGVTILAGERTVVVWTGLDFARAGSNAGGSNLQAQFGFNGGFGGSSYLTFINGLQPLMTAYRETISTATVSTATYNIDLSVANVFQLTLGSNVTFTFTNPPAAGVLASATVIAKQDAIGGRTATFVNSKYTDGNVPNLTTTANATDVLTFFTFNGGTSYFGTFAMANVS